MRTLLMGGQACVFYGAAEFSRDIDLLLVADPQNLNLLRNAMDSMSAEVIAVPPFDADYLRRGHAVHFRCKQQDVAGIRMDVMSKLRGVDDFEQLWSRRTTILVDDLEIDLLGIQDLVRAKKTQRDKDWPMIRRLVEQVYFSSASEPDEETINFLFRELRTPELLQELARKHPEAAMQQAASRPAIERAIKGSTTNVASALAEEETLERDRDRAWWEPLKRELEALRRSRRKGVE